MLVSGQGARRQGCFACGGYPVASVALPVAADNGHASGHRPDRPQGGGGPHGRAEGGVHHCSGVAVVGEGWGGEEWRVVSHAVFRHGASLSGACRASVVYTEFREITPLIRWVGSLCVRD